MRALIFISFLFISNAVFANCTQYNSLVSANAGDINVSNETPNGTLLATIEHTDFISMFNCTGQSRKDEFFIGGLGTQVATYDGLQVFSTSIPGIGVAVGGDSDCYDYSGGECHDVAPFPPVYIAAGQSQLMLGAYAITSHSVDWKSGYGIKIYKTGDVSEGTFSGNIAHWFMNDSGAGSTWLNLSGTVTVTPSTCTVLTPSVTANLGNHLTTAFTGVNSTTASVDVPVKLSCPAGIMVYAKLDATADTATPQPGAIKLTSSSVLTASGVAIQIVDANNNGVPIGSISQFKPLTPTILNFGWKARYLQTAEIVAAGDANASATVTINYQ